MTDQYPQNWDDTQSKSLGDEKRREELSYRSLYSSTWALGNRGLAGLIRTKRRTRNGRLRWVFEHFNIIGIYEFHRVPLPENGEHVGRRGRKATGQGWSLIAGLPKEQKSKRQR